MYECSKKKISDWRQEILTLQSQAQHGSGVLNLVQECSDCVTQEFYQVHKQYLSELNTVAVEVRYTVTPRMTARVYCFRARNFPEEFVKNLELLGNV